MLRQLDGRTGNRAMLVDNAGSHTIEASQAVLRRTTLIALPPNTTALMQPNDQGIIAAFKAHYRRHWLKKVYTRIEERIAILHAQNPGAQIPRDLAAKVLSLIFFCYSINILLN